jgi:DNA-binding response OmpR family regulator
MATDSPNLKKILLVEEAQGTREELKNLLKDDSYKVWASSDEEEAIDFARHLDPDMVLVSLTGTPTRILHAARRIRLKSGLNCRVPIVIYSSEIVAEGEEWEIDGNIHLVAPDNHVQLRMLIRRIVLATSLRR